jgi:hypothetical protein
MSEYKPRILLVFDISALGDRMIQGRRNTRGTEGISFINRIKERYDITLILISLLDEENSNIFANHISQLVQIPATLVRNEEEPLQLYSYAQIYETYTRIDPGQSMPPTYFFDTDPSHIALMNQDGRIISVHINTPTSWSRVNGIIHRSQAGAQGLSLEGSQPPPLGAAPPSLPAGSLVGSQGGAGGSQGGAGGSQGNSSPLYTPTLLPGGLLSTSSPYINATLTPTVTPKTEGGRRRRRTRRTRRTLRKRKSKK